MMIIIFIFFLLSQLIMIVDFFFVEGFEFIKHSSFSWDISTTPSWIIPFYSTV